MKKSLDILEPGRASSLTVSCWMQFILYIGRQVGLLEGFSLTCLACGVMGADLLPMEWIKIWRWENFWLIYSVVSLLVVPVVLAFVVVPKFGEVCGVLSADAILPPIVLGSPWGIEQLGVGICEDRNGLELTAS